MKNFRKLFLLPFLCLALGLSSCLNDGSNVYTYTSFGVVKYDYMTQTSLSTIYGEFLTPELILEVNSGDCLLANFTIDYDNQPTDYKYPTATNVTYVKLNQTYPYEVTDNDMCDSFNETISSVAVYSAPEFLGKMFVEITHNCNAKDSFSYELIINKDSVGTNGYYNAYLKANKDKTVEGSKETCYFYQAFDMNSQIMHYGEEFTASNNVKYRRVYFNLKYQTGTFDGQPVYTALREPIVVSVFM